MAAIDRVELLEDVKLYIRSDNIFTDSQINKFIDRVVSVVGDDDQYYEEVLCKSLRVIATNNKSQVTSSGSIKSRKIDDTLEESFYQGDNSGTWDDYLNTLPDVCTGFGYTGLNNLSLGFIRVNTGEDESVDDEPSIDVNPTSVNCQSTSSTLTSL